VKIPLIDSNYFLKFDLKKGPFPIESSDDILYLTPALNHRLDKIKELIISSQQLIVVTSSPGAGKTVLANHLRTLKEPNWMLSLVRGNEEMDVDTLVHTIIQEIFPDKSFDARQSVKQLQQFLETSALNGKLPVFIIDDAHELPVKTLEFVLQLAGQRYDKASFRIVLFADETISDCLEDQKLKAVIKDNYQNIHIPSFSKKQTTEYIDYRLALCGQYNEYPFTDKDIQHIFKLSAGLPGGINVLARQAMQDYVIKGTGVPRYVRFFIFPVIVVALFFLSYSVFIDKPKGPSNADTGNVISINIPPAKPLDEQPAENKKAQAQTRATVPVKKTTARVSVEIKKPVKQADEIMKNNELIINRQIALKSSGPIKTETKPQEISALPTEENDKKPYTTVIEPSADELGALIVDHAKEEKQLKTDVTVQPTIQSADKKEKVFDLQQVPEILAGIKSKGWFRHQPASSYVLQLTSSREIGNVQTLLRGQTATAGKLSGYTNYTPSGKVRYLLFYGIYPDRKSATAAAKRLPEKLRAVKPWPRTIANIIIDLDKLTVRGY